MAYSLTASRTFPIMLRCTMTTPPTVDKLITALDSSDVEVREAAKTALRKMGPDAVEPLIATMQTKTSRACWEAARVLSLIDDPRWIAPMEAALTSCAPLLGQVAVAALEPLGYVVAQAMIDALPRSHKVVQLQILAALEQICSREAVPAIVEVLRTATF